MKPSKKRCLVLPEPQTPETMKLKSTADSKHWSLGHNRFQHAARACKLIPKAAKGCLSSCRSSNNYLHTASSSLQETQSCEGSSCSPMFTSLHPGKNLYMLLPDHVGGYQTTKTGFRRFLHSCRPWKLKAESLDEPKAPLALNA